jgi:hypothetical protein
VRQKSRIRKLEQEIAPKRFVAIKLISHIPGEPPVQILRVPVFQGARRRSQMDQDRTRR